MAAQSIMHTKWPISTHNSSAVEADQCYVPKCPLEIKPELNKLIFLKAKTISDVILLLT